MKLTTDWVTTPWLWGGDPDETGKPREPWYAHAFYVPGYGWFGGFPPEVAQAVVEANNLSKARKQMIERFGLGEVWFWQGDGEDHLESLTCPVMIRPEQLQELLTQKYIEWSDQREATAKKFTAPRP